MNEFNLGNRLREADFYSDFDQSSAEYTLIKMYSSKEELEILSNLEKEATEARKEFNGYRSYLLNKAAQTNAMFNYSGYKIQ